MTEASLLNENSLLVKMLEVDQKREQLLSWFSSGSQKSANRAAPPAHTAKDYNRYAPTPLGLPVKPHAPEPCVNCISRGSLDSELASQDGSRARVYTGKDAARLFSSARDAEEARDLRWRHSLLR
jgi:hypothetical protein